MAGGGKPTTGITAGAIGDDRIYDNADYQNFVEGESIYDTLESEKLSPNSSIVNQMVYPENG